MPYLTSVNQPRRHFSTHQLVDRRMCEIASDYKKWIAEYRASDPDRSDPNGDCFCAVDDGYIDKVQAVASDMRTYNLIPSETLNDPYFDLWSFGCKLYDKYLKA